MPLYKVHEFIEAKTLSRSGNPHDGRPAGHCRALLEMFFFATESLKKTGSVCIVDDGVDLVPALQRNDLKLIGVGFIEYENRPDGDRAVACMIKGDKTLLKRLITDLNTLTGSTGLTG